MSHVLGNLTALQRVSLRTSRTRDEWATRADEPASSSVLENLTISSAAVSTKLSALRFVKGAVRLICGRRSPRRASRLVTFGALQAVKLMLALEFWRMAMNLIDALLLGIIEGVTEFLPVSSTGHLTIAEGLLGLQVDNPGVTAFTAIIQVGAIAAVIMFFRSDIRHQAGAWFRGLVIARPGMRPTIGSLGTSSSARYRLGSWVF